MKHRHWWNNVNVKNETAILEETIEQKLHLDKKVGALIIDMQPDFLSKIRRSERDVLITSHLEMIKFLAVHNVPIVVLEYNRHGVTQAEISQEVYKLAKYEYITKDHNNGFEEGKLDDRLKAWGIQDLIIIGINATACVKETAKSAVKKGYSIHTARQLIANPSNSQKEFRKDVLSWYEDNGVYLPDFRKLCKALES
ncbi:MAG: isochorismatase family protein [Candidatus Woesearchaeota archaeon]|jgi:hypothetical protein|nr:isochorismatase family protein [Candidatus Woesearchaeota archaeon]|tara:strand:+ start:5947 stop:6537 length:591 start_codon:yes stop_codon:yes gene_type:complete